MTHSCMTWPITVGVSWLRWRDCVMPETLTYTWVMTHVNSRLTHVNWRVSWLRYMWEFQSWRSHVIAVMTHLHHQFELRRTSIHACQLSHDTHEFMRDSYRSACKIWENTIPLYTAIWYWMHMNKSCLQVTCHVYIFIWRHDMCTYKDVVHIKM